MNSSRSKVIWLYCGWDKFPRDVVNHYLVNTKSIEFYLSLKILLLKGQQHLLQPQVKINFKYASQINKKN